MTNAELVALLREAREAFASIETVADDSYDCDCPPEWQRCGACRIKQHARSAQRDIAEALKAQEKVVSPKSIEVPSLIVGNLEWQAEVPEERMIWPEAKDYAASLGKGWRLPTRAELMTLVDNTRHNPACSVFPNCPSEWFWTSTPWAGSSSYAWYVNFYNGYADYSDVGSITRVRCVRDAAKEAK